MQFKVFLKSKLLLAYVSSEIFSDFLNSFYLSGSISASFHRFKEIFQFQCKSEVLRVLGNLRVVRPSHSSFIHSVTSHTGQRYLNDSDH